jgi:hypothetical protein
MGGNLPLGYDVKDRQLVVNEAEAETVRYLFERYVALGTVASLQTDLKQHGIVSKVWTSSSGKRRGGLGYSRGALYHLLRNPIYIGRITHRDTSYAGQHSGIVPRDLWDRVQALLTLGATPVWGLSTAPSTNSCSSFALARHLTSMPLSSVSTAATARTSGTTLQ